MNKVYTIVLDSLNFPNPNHLLYHLPQNQFVRYLLADKNIYSFTPILLQTANLQQPLTLQTAIIYQGNTTKEGYWYVDRKYDKSKIIRVKIILMKGDQIIKEGKQQFLFVHKQTKGLRMQTLLNRALGQFNQWNKFIQYQNWIGYNCFHFPPLNKLGDSRSYYSISNHLKSQTEFLPSFQSLVQLFKEFPSVNFFTDIVLNHISNTSELVVPLKNGLYTPEKVGMLNVVYLVDKKIFQMGQLVKKKQKVINQQELKQIRQELGKKLQQLNVWKYFQLEDGIAQKLIKAHPPTKEQSFNIFKSNYNTIELFFQKQVIGLGVGQYSVSVNLQKWKTSKINYDIEELTNYIDYFNQQWKNKAINWIHQALDNIINQLRSKYLNKKILGEFPWVQKAFSELQCGPALNNGWIMDADPLQNFATSKQFYYLRRKVFIWGDLLKLNYGQRYEDAPQLWKHMTEYIEMMAKIFNGFRLDNLHGTPLQVASYFMEKARAANPQLIIFGQLFTGSQQKDALFVKSIGINALVRQTNWMVNTDDIVNKLNQYMYNEIQEVAWYKQQQERVFLNARLPYPLIFTQTHDNQKVPNIRHLSMLSLLLSISQFFGSTHGYQECLDKINVCNDDRKYILHQVIKEKIYEKDQLEVVIMGKGKIKGSWDDWKGESTDKVCLTIGKYQFKFFEQDEWLLEKDYKVNKNGNHEIQIKNSDLHYEEFINLLPFTQFLNSLLSKYSFLSYKHLSKLNSSIVTLRKSNRQYPQELWIITAIHNNKSPQLLQIRGHIKLLKVAKMDKQGFIMGQSLLQYAYVYEKGDYTCIKFSKLPASLTVIIITQSPQVIVPVITQKYPILNSYQINNIFFSSLPQQLSRYGRQTYKIDNQNLVYGGIGGIYMRLKWKYMGVSNRGSIKQNVFKGNWLIDYTNNRINQISQNHPIIKELQAIKSIKPQQRLFNLCTLIYKFFNQTKSFVYQKATPIKKVLKTQPSNFIKNLIFASYQFINKTNQSCSFAAGLPHFAVGWSREWGRDTFISMKGCLLLTGLWSQAKQIILKFSRSLQRGLIPNLLDDLKNPRYNCRDAAWWYIKSIFDYMQITQDYNILQQKVQLIHNNQIISVEDIIQSIFQQHASGIKFRQRNAGSKIDQHMNSQGFNIHLKLDIDTGFIIGGNSRNCLTWMDKMGQGSNQGWPASSRNGSPVELVGLLKYCLKKVIDANKKGIFKYQQVKIQGKQLKYQTWCNLIQQNFQKWYWIDNNSENWHFSIKAQRVKHRNILKDLVKSQTSKVEYYFRPNSLIAVCLCPQLLGEKRIELLLKNIQQFLSKYHQQVCDKSLGVKTLSQVHSLYTPFYDNEYEGNQIIEKGFSYHNGPEWVWLYGYYVMTAVMIRKKSLSLNFSLLTNHIQHINKSQWLSLPQLTNHNGSPNPFSSPSQAWSISTIIQSIYSIYNQ